MCSANEDATINNVNDQKVVCQKSGNVFIGTQSTANGKALLTKKVKFKLVHQEVRRKTFSTCDPHHSPRDMLTNEATR